MKKIIVGALLVLAAGCSEVESETKSAEDEMMDEVQAETDGNNQVKAEEEGPVVQSLEDLAGYWFDEEAEVYFHLEQESLSVMEGNLISSYPVTLEEDYLLLGKETTEDDYFSKENSLEIREFSEETLEMINHRDVYKLEKSSESAFENFYDDNGNQDLTESVEEEGVHPDDIAGTWKSVDSGNSTYITLENNGDEGGVLYLHSLEEDLMYYYYSYESEGKEIELLIDGKSSENLEDRNTIAFIVHEEDLIQMNYAGPGMFERSDPEAVADEHYYAENEYEEEDYYFENEYGETSSIPINYVEEIEKYVKSNGGTLEDANFYQAHWEENGWGESYFIMPVGIGGRVVTFHGGEDGIVYFTNLDFDPDTLDPEYTPINEVN